MNGPRPEPQGYRDRQNRPISLAEWERLSLNQRYRNVRRTEGNNPGDIVATAWSGLVSPGGETLGFYTVCIVGGHFRCEQWTTLEQEALNYHREFERHLPLVPKWPKRKRRKCQGSELVVTAESPAPISALVACAGSATTPPE